MSNMERCVSVLNCFSENQLANIATMLEAAQAAIEEAEDDAFCGQLYQAYEADTDPEKHDTITIEELAERLGITLIRNL